MGDRSGTTGWRRGWRWRPRWPAAALMALLAIALLARLAWGWWVDRQVRAAIDELHRRGEPVTEADVRRAEIPEDENAAVPLMRAMAIVSASRVASPRNGTLDFPAYPPYTPAWHRAARASEAAHAQAFEAARLARSRPRGAFLATFGSQGFAMLPLSDAGALAATLADGAVYAHLNGDDAEALERLRDALLVARILREDPDLFAQLVAARVDGTTCEAVFTIAAGLTIEPAAAGTRPGTRPGTPPGTPTPSRPASRRAVLALIADLLDDARVTRAAARGMSSMRAAYLDELVIRASGTWVIRPLADREQLRTIATYDACARAAMLPDWPAMRDALSAEAADPTVRRIPWPRQELVPRYSRWFASSLAAHLHLEGMTRALAERRAAAVALAMRLHRAERGRFPPDLEALVPDCLPAVPADPFGGGGRRIGYAPSAARLPDGSDRPMLFFGPDDPPGGPAIPPEPNYCWYDEPWSDALRQYRDLLRFSPPPPPPAPVDPDSPEAVDDDPQEADGPRQEAQ